MPTDEPADSSPNDSGTATTVRDLPTPGRGADPEHGGGEVGHQLCAHHRNHRRGIGFRGRRHRAALSRRVALGSPWAITALRQAPMWRGDFAARYGDGTMVQCLSADVSDWDTPGILFGKPAERCSKDIVVQEVWAQLERWLNTGTGWLRDDVHSWFVDPGVHVEEGNNRTDTPLLVNPGTTGRRRIRRSATCSSAATTCGPASIWRPMEVPARRDAKPPTRCSTRPVTRRHGRRCSRWTHRPSSSRSSASTPTAIGPGCRIYSICERLRRNSAASGLAGRNDSIASSATVTFIGLPKMVMVLMKSSAMAPRSGSWWRSRSGTTA